MATNEKTVLVESDYITIDKMLQDGKNLGQIGRAIGMGRATFIRVKDGDERIKEMQDKYRSLEEEELRNLIWDNIRDRNIPYREKRPDVFFLLKTQHGYRETARKDELEATVKAVKDEFVGYDIKVVPKKTESKE